MVRGTHRYPPMERVIYGVPLAEALDEEVNRLDARAVYVMASGTLNRETDVVDSVRRVLGNRFAGVCAKIGSHTPAHRRGGGGERGPRGERRSAADSRRRLRHGCGQNGWTVPGQRRHRAGPA